MRVFLAGEGCWDLKCSGFSGGVVRRLLFAYCFWLFVRFAIFRSLFSKYQGKKVKPKSRLR